MIRRHANVFGIMNGKLINLVSDLAFVANGVIEDRKKRLIAGAVFPMRLRLLSFHTSPSLPRL